MYITSPRVQAAIRTQREIDHAVMFGYGTAEQHDAANELLQAQILDLTPEERDMYDAVIDLYR